MSLTIHSFHLFVFLACVAIAAFVFLAMLYTLVKNHRSQLRQSQGFHARLVVEILWAVVPFLILIAMVLPAVLVVIR